MNPVFHNARLRFFFAFLLGMSASNQVWSADLAGDYNQGVQQYQESKFDEAAALFRRAAASSDDGLAAKSRYNLGNSLYAKAAHLIRRSSQNQAGTGGALESTPQSEPEVDPIDLLEDAIGAFRSSLRLNPDDEDARFNLENATRLIDQLKKQKSDQKSPRQEQKQDQEKDPSQQQEKNDPENKPEQDPEPQNEQNDESSKQEQAEEKEQPGEARQPEEPGQSEEKDSSEEKSDPNEGEGKESQPNEPEQGSPEQGSPEQGSPGQTRKEQPGESQMAEREMTEQEAKKMLQAIRDRDMQRRQRLEALKRSRRIVVPRDW